MSHNIKEYALFMQDIIEVLNNLDQPIVFLLWGGPARNKKKLIDTSKHLVLESVHPSPLSANRGGWFGNHHFSLCNRWLQQQGMQPIEW
jgi:uracil-DNA glycosylase